MKPKITKFLRKRDIYNSSILFQNFNQYENIKRDKI